MRFRRRPRPRRPAPIKEKVIGSGTADVNVLALKLTLDPAPRVNFTSSLTVYGAVIELTKAVTLALDAPGLVMTGELGPATIDPPGQTDPAVVERQLLSVTVFAAEPLTTVTPRLLVRVPEVGTLNPSA